MIRRGEGFDLLQALLRAATWLGAGPAVERTLPAHLEQASQAVHGEPPRGDPAFSLAAPSPAAAPAPSPNPSTLPPAVLRESIADREPQVSPEPAPALPLVPVTVGAHELTLTLGDRIYRVRGLAKNPSPETLRVTLLVSRGGPAFSDALDLPRRLAALALVGGDHPLRHPDGLAQFRLDEAAPLAGLRHPLPERLVGLPRFIASVPPRVCCSKSSMGVPPA